MLQNFREKNKKSFFKLLLLPDEYKKSNKKPQISTYNLLEISERSRMRIKLCDSSNFSKKKNQCQ